MIESSLKNSYLWKLLFKIKSPFLAHLTWLKRFVRSWFYFTEKFLVLLNVLYKLVQLLFRPLANMLSVVFLFGLNSIFVFVYFIF